MGIINTGGLLIGPYGNEFAKFVYDDVANVWVSNIPLAVTGNVVATGNVNCAHVNSTGITVAGGITATSSIVTSGERLVAYGFVSDYGNIANDGTITSGGLITAPSIHVTSASTLNTVTANAITAGNITVSGNVTAAYFSGNGSQLTNTPDVTPAGVITMFGGATAPTGYLLCNGNNVSRTTYARLFAAIGTLYGVGDGSTTFTLPAFTNRFPVGVGSFHTLASGGGNAHSQLLAHTHTATSVVTDPGHNHVLTDPGHQHSYNTPTAAAAANITGTNPAYGAMLNPAPGSGTSVQATGVQSVAANTNITVSTTVDSSGTTATNGNLPPYLTVNFIIKT